MEVEIAVEPNSRSIKKDFFPSHSSFYKESDVLATWPTFFGVKTGLDHAVPTRICSFH